MLILKAVSGLLGFLCAGMAFVFWRLPDLWKEKEEKPDALDKLGTVYCKFAAIGIAGFSIILWYMVLYI